MFSSNIGETIEMQVNAIDDYIRKHQANEMDVQSSQDKLNIINSKYCIAPFNEFYSHLSTHGYINHASNGLVYQELMTHPVALDGDTSNLVDFYTLLKWWAVDNKNNHQNPITHQQLKSITYQPLLKSRIDEFLILIANRKHINELADAELFILTNRIQDLIKPRNIEMAINLNMSQDGIRQEGLVLDIVMKKMVQAIEAYILTHHTEDRLYPSIAERYNRISSRERSSAPNEFYSDLFANGYFSNKLIYKRMELMTHPVILDGRQDHTVDFDKLVKWWHSDPKYMHMNPMTNQKINFITYDKEFKTCIDEYINIEEKRYLENQISDVKISVLKNANITTGVALERLNNADNELNLPLECYSIYNSKHEPMSHPVILDNQYSIDYIQLNDIWDKNPLLVNRNPMTGELIQSIQYDQKLKDRIEESLKNIVGVNTSSLLIAPTLFGLPRPSTYSPQTQLEPSFLKRISWFR